MDNTVYNTVSKPESAFKGVKPIYEPHDKAKAVISRLKLSKALEKATKSSE